MRLAGPFLLSVRSWGPVFFFKVEVEVKVRVRVEVKVEVKVKAGVEVKVRVRVEVKVRVRVEVKVRVRVEVKVRVRVEVEVGVEVKSQKSKVKIQGNPKKHKVRERRRHYVISKWVSALYRV
jgi:hypothetical protein